MLFPVRTTMPTETRAKGCASWPETKAKGHEARCMHTSWHLCGDS